MISLVSDINVLCLDRDLTLNFIHYFKEVKQFSVTVAKKNSGQETFRVFKVVHASINEFYTF